MTGSWWIFTCSPFVPQTKFLPFLKQHLNGTFQGIGQIESSSIKDRWMGYIFLPSDRLRHCRGAAVTPPQSVTATVFPAVTQQEGSTAVFFVVFYQTHCQHNSSIYGLFFRLLWTPGYSLFFKAICMRLCRGMLVRQKETASMWVQAQGSDTDGSGYTLRNTECI